MRRGGRSSVYDGPRLPSIVINPDAAAGDRASAIGGEPAREHDQWQEGDRQANDGNDEQPRQPLLNPAVEIVLVVRALDMGLSADVPLKLSPVGYSVEVVTHWNWIPTTI